MDAPREQSRPCTSTSLSAVEMPVLTPSLSSPTSRTLLDVSQDPIQSGSTPKPAAMLPGPDPDSEGKSSDPPSTVSRFSLDVENISAEVASDLASALVGHILFLKNQVPFWFLRQGTKDLSLMIFLGAQSNPKALKLRTDLLASFDTLCSHLNTSFTALSTAFALATTGPGPRPTRRAYLAVLVGPSIGSAKAKVMFAVDGLATKVWGERDDLREELSDDESDESDEAEDDSDASAEGDNDEQSSELSDIDSTDSDGASPPPSRSPSPSPPPSSSRKALHAPTRLLAHTLATADHSMSAELAPSQTHILLRAPRRFTHPAWIPRQTVSSTLENALLEFREEAGDASPANKVEGVWVTCQSPGVEYPDEALEECDMIWWSWDGKIVGFTDW
ncbi:hypothetical protein K438DRAFT_1850056 [Mycena galopus ATCC 62051]|nr:hypothetical protein K438DRAFT_1850056 [Mycena galopus ATCC 62051]